MLVTPRVLREVYDRLVADPLLADLLPGGVWIDAVAEPERAYPALVVTALSTAPNPQSDVYWDVLLELAVSGEGTDTDVLLPIVDRADVVLRRIGLDLSGQPLRVEVDGVTLGNVRKIAEVVRTAPEQGVFFGTAGAQYVIRCGEPQLGEQ